MQVGEEGLLQMTDVDPVTKTDVVKEVVCEERARSLTKSEHTRCGHVGILKLYQQVSLDHIIFGESEFERRVQNNGERGGGGRGEREGGEGHCVEVKLLGTRWNAGLALSLILNDTDTA